MKYAWLDEYCLSKPGARKDYQAEWQAERFLLDNKMFGMKGGDKHGAAIITLKCEPDFGRMLREQYKHIVPGYYMNKEHWNSVYVDGDVPDDVLRQMVDMSYRLIMASLPKKTQRLLLAETTD